MLSPSIPNCIWRSISYVKAKYPDSCSSPLFGGGTAATCISAMTACHGMAEGEVPEVREKNEKGKGSLCPHQHPYSKVFSIGVGDWPNYCVISLDSTIKS